MNGTGLWTDLLTSVRARRSHDAPFFKPACLIAVVDLIEEGALDPTVMDADRIVARVDEIVRDVHWGRPDMRWRPVWHLSNDGAWVFTKGGRRIGPDDFKPAKKPDSLRQWRESFDRLAVPPEMVAYWRSPTHRAALRQGTLAMLEEGNAACRTLALDLANGVRETPGIDKARRSGQGFASDAAVRRAVEARAMELTRSWLLRGLWAVEDCSGSESYDLLATRDGERIFVEVKGTTGNGETIQLTRLEVEFALANRAAMALAVVSGISVAQTDHGPEASGGALVVRRGWAPQAGSLRPIAYACRLEDTA